MAGSTWGIRAWMALCRHLQPRRAALAGLREAWGKPGTHDGLFASRYFDLTQGAHAAHEVDETTWRDLEWPQVFAHLDTTLTTMGCQVLYARLRRPLEDADVLAARHATAARLRDDVLLRESIQLALRRFGRATGQEVASYLRAALPPPSRGLRLLQAWALASIAAIVWILAFGGPGWLLAPILGANLFIAMANLGNVHRQTETLGACL
ncbi:MAG TPA: hypothetical protein VF271_08855, partial [Rhodanobacteraceae bacterium]